MKEVQEVDFFDKLGKKINETTHLVKLNGLIADEEKQINGFLLQIGQITFDQYTENPDSPITGLVTQINEAKSRIEVHSAEIRKLKGYAKCESCGAEVPPDNAFCAGCGARLEAAPEPDNVQSTGGAVCSNCGATVPEDMAFCTGCGTKVQP